MSKINFIRFPDLNNANQDGLLATGGDLSVDTLVSAYSQGIFPWFNQNQPILWWSPNPRLVLFPNEVKISRSLAKCLRKKHYKVTVNKAFEEIIENCASRCQKPAQRPSHRADFVQAIEETWITQSMQEAYIALHQQSYAHSIEVWQQDTLVGGLYGLALGKVFFGESMFSSATDASKVALASLCTWLRAHNWKVIDCQVSSSHLLSLGAREIARSEFISYLQDIDIHQTASSFAQEITQYAPDSVINKS